MLRISQLKIVPEEFEKNPDTCILNKIAREISRPSEEILTYKIVRKSIDARKKPIVFYILTVDFQLKDEKILIKKLRNKNITVSQEETYHFPQGGTLKLEKPPVIVGSGPAGLFCAYYLALNGFCPIVLEQGEDVDQRSKSVETFWNHGILKPESNVQFGEGGAGTFSDGKLNTLVKDKYGRNREVLKTFVKTGAPEEILYESKPHIGTDILCKIVKNIRQEIIAHGGQVLFGKKVTNVITRENKIQAVQINQNEIMECDVLILAIGHSARDTFEMLYQNGLSMEAKSFAVGLRVEHPQSMINQSQYGAAYSDCLQAASYKLAAKSSSDRGVYSFCMCPGGFVVNASSENKRLAVNGMSYSKRDSKNANSAIIVSVSPDDFPSIHPLAGIEFQRNLEEKAFELGNGSIPIQLYGDFQANASRIPSHLLFEPQIKGAYSFANLRSLFPEEINHSFLEGMSQFQKMIPGFAMSDAILSGVESRTSSPVRILRNDSVLEGSIRGIYPCGEGAGYAGGITSAAMDGIKVAEVIGATYLHKKQ